MKYLAVNPAAGNARDLAFWQESLRNAGVETEAWPTGEGAATPALTEADRLLVAGGDGTVRRYVPLCLDSGAVLGVLPSGTGNDFARGLGISLDPDEACATVAADRVRHVDVGRFGEHLFLNVAHIGLGSDIAPELDAETKRSWGRLSYLRRALEQLRHHRGFRATIRCNGASVRGRWLEIAVANGSSFGGGHQFFEASPFDGQLDVVAVRRRPLYRLIGVWLWAWIRRSMPAHEAIVLRREAGCVIDTRRRRRVTADGEEAGEVPGRFFVQPGALRVIVPSAD